MDKKWLPHRVAADYLVQQSNKNPIALEATSSGFIAGHQEHGTPVALITCFFASISLIIALKTSRITLSLRHKWKRVGERENE